MAIRINPNRELSSRGLAGERVSLLSSTLAPALSREITVVVESTGNAYFRDGSRITLENGFSVASGGVFTAEIVGSP